MMEGVSSIQRFATAVLAGVHEKPEQLVPVWVDAHSANLLASALQKGEPSSQRDTPAAPGAPGAAAGLHLPAAAATGEAAAEDKDVFDEDDAATATNVAQSGHGMQVWFPDQWETARTEAALRRLEAHVTPVSAFWKGKREDEGARIWSKFYSRHANRFFKDRHYLHHDFPELRAAMIRPVTMLELGCGVGNAFYPLLEALPYLHVIATDFACTAIDVLMQHPQYDPKRVIAFEADAARQQVAVAARQIRPEGVDFCLLLFVLSAVPPKLMPNVFEQAAKALKPGGVLFVRDYGRYDEAQLRFADGKRIEDNYYVRHDGTLAYYFLPEELHRMATAAGLVVVECTLLYRIYRNRKQSLELRRVWIHGKFRRPWLTIDSS